MQLRLRPAIRLEHRQGHTFEGDMTRSLFKGTEKLLKETDFQKSLEFVAQRKKMSRYRDMIDFLFCELVVGFSAKCFRFYDGAGPALRDDPVATPERIAEWDRFLMASLHVAHKAMDEQRRLSWTRFRFDTNKAFSKAA